MDNRTIDITSEGNQALKQAVELVWPNAPGGKVTHYLIESFRKKTEYFQNDKKEVTHHFTDLVKDKEGVETLILLWHEEGGAAPLPFPLDVRGAVEFISNWLRVVDYGRQPSHDGDNEKGWRVFNEAWGHVAHMHYAVLAVQPAWAMYGK